MWSETLVLYRSETSNIGLGLAETVLILDLVALVLILVLVLVLLWWSWSGLAELVLLSVQVILLHMHILFTLWTERWWRLVHDSNYLSDSGVLLYSEKDVIEVSPSLRELLSLFATLPFDIGVSTFQILRGSDTEAPQRFSTAGEITWEHKKHQNSWRLGTPLRSLHRSPSTAGPAKAPPRSQHFGWLSWSWPDYFWSCLHQSVFVILDDENLVIFSYFLSDQLNTL